MPRDLPGLYWDEQRKRYFPLSARPAAQTQAGPSNPNRHGGSRIIFPLATTAHTLRGANSDVPLPPPRKRRRMELLPDGSVGLGLVGEGLRLSTNYSKMREHAE